MSKYNLEICLCEICGSKNDTVVWDKKDRANKNMLYSKVIEDDGEIIHGINVICNGCGLIYVNPRMTKESLDKFYKEDYRNIYGETMELNSEKMHAYSAAQLISFTQPKTHLDIGASTGQLVNLCNVNGIKSTGIECNERNAKYAIEQGYNVININFDDYETNEQFDVITILNTLEHMYSPYQTLKKINKLLKPDHYLLISIPDIYNIHLRKPMDAYLSNAHLYNFSKRTLELLLNKAGFEMQMYQYIPEEIGNKLYVLAQKVSENPNENVNYAEFENKVDPNYVASFLTHADATFVFANILNPERTIANDTDNS